jgi:prepilin-type N-terminal cleavage/methylation domain-containing protein
MLKTTRRSTAGFTLIELLTVIAIIGILASIIIPTVGKVQEKARRTTDLSNMKQVLMAASIHANDHNGRYPGLLNRRLNGTAGTEAVTAFNWAGVIAVSAGLNDPGFYLSKSDANYPASIPVTILARNNGAVTGLDTTFSGLSDLSVELVAGITQSAEPTTPLVFTRGLETTGKWSATKGVYKDEGGYVGFIGGNVVFYKDLMGDLGTGTLTNTSGSVTSDILTTIKSTARVYGTANAGTGSTTGKAGSGT